jgi:hypothetical protein
MATLVYRVEDPDGTGPYQLLNRLPLLDKLLERHNHLSRTPQPCWDGFSYNDAHPSYWHRFGFVDLRSLKTWFNAVERSLLAAEGCVIRVYNVGEIDWIGRSGQLYFNRGRAVPVATLNLTKRG